MGDSICHRIALDVDGVVSNFSQAVINKARELGLSHKFPNHWQNVECWNLSKQESDFLEIWQHIKNDINFWMHVPPFKITVPFTPVKYVTSRPIESWITAQWLAIHKFPKAEVITVAKPFDKLQHLQDVDIFVDDHWETIRYLRANGVNALLYDAPYQRGHDCDDLPKIHTLEEIWTN